MKMKRMLMWLLILCVMLSGCGVKKEAAESSEGKNPFSETERLNHTETASVASLPKETTPEERKSALLQKLYKEDRDYKGAYLLPITWEEEESIICIECRQEELLILSANTDLHIRLFNLDTGKMDAHRTIKTDWDGLGDGGYLSDGNIWVYIPGQGKLYYMNQKLEDQGEKTLSAHDEWYSDNQKDILWFLDHDSNILLSYQIASEEMQEYDMEALIGEDLGMAGLDWSVEKAAYGSVYLNRMIANGMQERFCFSPSDKKILARELMRNMYMYLYSDGGAYKFQDQYRIVDYLKPDQLLNIKGKDSSECIVDYKQGYLISEVEGKIRIYDCSEGNCYGAYKIEPDGEAEEELGNYVPVTAVRPEERQIIFSFEMLDKKKLVLYDLDMAEVTEHFACGSSAGSQIRQQLEQGLNELEQKYSIDILTVEEVKKHDDESGYILEENQYLLNQLDAYTAFYSFLNKLPEGMVAEILAGNSGKIEMYFCGPITGAEGSGNLSSAGGYVTRIYNETTDSWYSRMVADISDPEALQRYLAHEFFHLMENQFTECEYDIAMIREGMKKREGELTSGEAAREEIVYDWVSQWIDLSPEDAYLYDNDETLCYSEHGVDYVYIDEEDMDRVYFVDAYGRTYPNEDRARLFEYLYMDSIAGEDSGWLESRHLRDKAVYLCQLLRCCYPSADGISRNFWEQVLNDEDWARIEENRLQRQ